MAKLLDLSLKREIAKQEIFSNVDLDGIEAILNTCPEVAVNQGDTLISSESHNHSLYLVIEGRLRVHLATDMHTPITTLLPGQSVGEESAIGHQLASAIVLADTNARLIKIDEDKLWCLIESSHAIAKNILVVLSRRLHHSNIVINKIKDLLREHEYNAAIDPLTSLYNRRWLDNALGRVIQRCESSNQPLSLVIIDIDYFKQYNDTNGHLAGDSALRAVAKTVLQNLRPEDLVTRYGGEELLALLPGLNIVEAGNVAERLRVAVESMKIKSNDGTLLPPLTISAGIAEMQEESDPLKIIEKADAALYRAKSAGRNRVCC